MISKINVNPVSFGTKEQKKASKPTPQAEPQTSHGKSEVMSAPAHIKVHAPILVPTRLLKDKKTGLILFCHDIYDCKTNYYYKNDGTLKYKVSSETLITPLKKLTSYRQDGKTPDFMCVMSPDSQSLTFYDKQGKKESTASLHDGLTYRDNNGIFTEYISPKKDIDKISIESFNGKHCYTRTDNEARSSGYKKGVIEYYIKEKNERHSVRFSPQTHSYLVLNDRGGSCVYDAMKKEVTTKTKMSEAKAMSLIERLPEIEDCLFSKQDEVKRKMAKVGNAKEDIMMLKALDTHFLSE